MNVRTLVRRGLWLLGFLCLWLPVFDDPPLATGAYVQDVTTDRATVAMVTATPQVRSLTLRDAAGEAVEVAAARSEGRRHTFSLQGLRPGQGYAFEVRDADGAVVDQGGFRTAPAGDDARVRFAVVGDSGGLPWWIWLQNAPLWYLPARWQWLPPRSTVATIGDRIAAADPDFVLHVGDIVYPRGEQAHYSAGFFRPFAEVLRRAPYYVALGNHDVMEDEGRQALSNFHLPRGERTGDERCYSFARGSVRVVVLDFNWQRDSDRVEAGHPALEFLRAELQTRTEPWLVVASHFPIRSASRSAGRADLQLSVLPLLTEYGADLYVSGHDHVYQRFGGDGEGGLVEIVSGGGGKSLYEIKHHPRVRVAESRYHWCLVEVEGRVLRLRARSLEGDLLDTVELRRSDDDAHVWRIDQVNPGRAARIRALGR